MWDLIFKVYSNYAIVIAKSAGGAALVALVIIKLYPIPYNYPITVKETFIVLISQANIWKYVLFLSLFYILM